MKNDNKTKAEIILGLPIANDFQSKYHSHSSGTQKGKYYDIDALTINTKPGRRTITPALGKEMIKYAGDSHLMTIAPTGSGKGRGVIIPNLLTYTGPVIVVDPKGENYAVTARRRKEMGQEVYVLDPFKVMVEESDSLNPLDIFDLKNSDVETDAQMLAELISSESMSAKEPFWDINARALHSGVFTYLATQKEKSERNIRNVNKHLMGGDTVYNNAVILDTIKDLNELAFLEISSFVETADITRSGILATANSYMKAFIGQQVAKAFDTSSFSLQDIIDGKPITIYIIVPPDKIKSHSSILKVWIGVLLRTISTRKVIPDERTLFILDECGQLGTFPLLETAMTLLRGYGLQTWTFWQDISQIKKLYDVAWSTMVNNCAVLQIFGTNNYRVAGEFAEMIGIDTEQVSSIRKSDQILLINGEELLKSRRFDYLENKEFKDQLGRNFFDDNPFYRKVKKS